MDLDWSQLDWGNVPAWAGSILTSSSLLIAALSYRRSVLDKERDQASKVAAWVVLADSSESQKRMLRVSNSRDASIYEITVRLRETPEVFLEELPAKTTTTIELPAARSSSKIETSGIAVRLLFIEASVTTETLSQESPPELEFCDALGRWWKRIPRGQLKRIQSRRRTTYRSRILVPLINLSTGSIDTKDAPESTKRTEM